MKFAMTYSGFPTGAPWNVTDGKFPFATNWFDVTWAAVTVGRRNLHDVFRHGRASWFEAVYRAHMTWANLKTDSNDRLRRTLPYKNLDPSEKGAVSYFLGMAMTKLVAADRLGTPWLSHMSTFTGGKLLSPDLIGPRMVLGEQPGKDWVVLEAKGRTGNIDKSVKKNAEHQASMPLSLKGRGRRIVPSLRVASVMYFQEGRMKGWWKVPRTRRKTSASYANSVEVAASRFGPAYYAPILGLLDSTRVERTVRHIENREFDTAQFPELDLAVGLDTRLTRRLRHKDSGASIDSMLSWMAESLRPRIEMDRAVAYPDGVFIELGPMWTSEAMKQEPRERH